MKPNNLKPEHHLSADQANTLAPNIDQQTLLIKKVQQCYLQQGIKFRDFRENISFVYANKETE
jgi:hypothetical protein